MKSGNDIAGSGFSALLAVVLTRLLAAAWREESSDVGEDIAEVGRGLGVALWVLVDHAAVAIASMSRSGAAEAASSRKCANRDLGMPLRRQLCTVDSGASVIRATAVVPPKASMI